MEGFLQVVLSFIGCLGFAMLYNLHGKKLWISGIGGLISWASFLMFQYFMENNFLMNMFAAIVATAYAEIAARVTKAPATVYLVSSIISLVPGGNLYYTMNYALAKNWQLFTSFGQRTLIIAMALSGGIMMASSLYRLCHEMGKYYRGRTQKKKDIQFKK